MCDDFTREEEDAALARMDSMRGISRRQFAALGGAAAIAACAPNEMAAAEASTGDVTGRKVTFETEDGTADAYFVHPSSGKHPAVIMWPDVAGLREAYEIMATRLASAGYAVLAVNPYYRGGPAPTLGSFMEWRTEEGQAKIRPLREALNPQAITRDAESFVTFLDMQSEVDSRKGIGTCGYCMGGPFTVRTAAAVPARVRAAASFQGGGLVTEAPNSPHLLIQETKAKFLIAVAENDDARSPGDKDVLRATADQTRHEAEIEVYPAPHGWCPIDSPVYDQVQADRAWDRMLALYKRAL